MLHRRIVIVHTLLAHQCPRANIPWYSRCYSNLITAIFTAWRRKESISCPRRRFGHFTLYVWMDALANIRQTPLSWRRSVNFRCCSGFAQNGQRRKVILAFSRHTSGQSIDPEDSIDDDSSLMAELAMVTARFKPSRTRAQRRFLEMGYKIRSKVSQNHEYQALFCSCNLRSGSGGHVWLHLWTPCIQTSSAGVNTGYDSQDVTS
jgi:hypothetical protein